MVGEVVPEVDGFLGIVVVGVGREGIVEFFGYLLLIVEQLLATKDIIRYHRKLAFLEFSRENQTPNHQILKLADLHLPTLCKEKIHQIASQYTGLSQNALF